MICLSSSILYVERISYPPVAFGRLYPRGVDVQVKNVWSAWVSEDGLMLTHPFYVFIFGVLVALSD